MSQFSIFLLALYSLSTAESLQDGLSSVDQATKAYSQADDELNNVYKKALEREGADVELLTKAQRAWLKYRDACVDSEKTLASKGNEEICRFQVLAALTKERVRQLKAYAGHSRYYGMTGDSSLGKPYIAALDECMKQVYAGALAAFPAETKPLLEKAQDSWNAFSEAAIILEPEKKGGSDITILPPRVDCRAQLARDRLERLCDMFPKGLPTPIRVSSAIELASAIGSNRIIELLPGTYTLTDANIGCSYYEYKIAARGDFGCPLVAWCDMGDYRYGFQPVVMGVSNLTLRGVDPNKVKLMLPVANETMLRFRECKNISVQSITAGHGPEQGFCTSGVLEFSECTNVKLKNCDIFGCGAEGIDLYKVKNAEVCESIIHDCSGDIATIQESADIIFSNCRFSDTPGAFGIFGNVNNICFDACDMRTCTPAGSDSIEVGKNREHQSVRLVNCLFSGRDIRKYFRVGTRSALTVENCTGS